MLYADTSALLPYYRPESLSAACERHLLESRDGVAVSELTEVEITSALARLVRIGELSNESADRIFRAFSSDLDQGALVRVTLAARCFPLAREWLFARRTALRTLDALHLAAAASSGAELLTADNTLADAAALLGVPFVRVI
ncbi:MAG: type II toxin-antitoxin system VapC family toxin [Deltaproteobacteria bacterium]|nr:type II toxin-antitoxin system VapC family toxin [Deltaproteobacteria bacterium]